MPQVANQKKIFNGPRLGAHVSAAGSVADAVQKAYELGCECFQFFSRSPRGGPAPKLDKQTIALFRQRSRGYDLPSVIHAPYYINFASDKLRIRQASSRVLREELERGSLLGCQAMMTHLGSTKDLGEKQALKLTAEGIIELLKGYKGTTQFLIELSAGAGAIIGDSFEEVATIIKQVEKKVPARVGVCFDTCHAFVSGYDLRTAKDVAQTLTEFNKIIGLDRLKVIHLNDAKFELGSRRDRHEHIGLGEIGETGIQALLNYKKMAGLLAILETPSDDKRIQDLELVKKLRDGKE
ncbi:MAG: deoxyribonuclease IV [bacterium]